MDQQTRKFLALLSSEAGNAILERLKSGSAAKTDLVKELGIGSREIAGTLDMLELAGLVRSRRGARKSGGRPRELWELAGEEEVAGLEKELRELRHRLIDQD
jgi:predicted transcriptional regulator